MTPQHPAIPPCLTPPPPPQPDPVYASGVKKKTSIVDCDQFVEYFVSLLRSPHFPPALTTPESAESAEAHTRATGPNPGGEKMRADSKGHAIAIVAALPNPLKRKLSLQEPEDRDPWNYESRQFTPNSKPNPNFKHNPDSKPNHNFQNPNSKPNHNFQNPNSKPNPNFQNPNSNPNFQNPNSNSNPNFQSYTPTTNATLAQGVYTGGVTVSSSPNPTDPQPPEILPGYTYPGYTYAGYTYPGYTYPGSGYAGVVSVSQFTSNSPINPIPSPSNTQSQPQARWSGGNWGTGYPGAGYVTTGLAGTSYPGAVSSGSRPGYPGVLLYPEMGYSDMDFRGQAYPRSGIGLGSTGTVMPPGSLYSTTPSPANPSYLALTQPSLDPASYSAWTATDTGVAIETSTAEYLPHPQ